MCVCVCVGGGLRGLCFQVMANTVVFGRGRGGGGYGSFVRVIFLLSFDT